MTRPPACPGRGARGRIGPRSYDRAVILVDPPAWPAHDTLWSHLVSDHSLAELHDFAAGLGIGRRAFDLDHYDIPADRHADAVAAGAVAIGGGDLTRRLIASGLRVPGRDRAVLKGLRRRWLALRPGDHATVDDLLVRWREPHRTYHGPTHLAEALAALDVLTGAEAGPSTSTGRAGTAPGTLDDADRRTAELALWFHDAVHDGRTPQDEDASAALALAALGDPRVAELIRMTARHDPDPADRVAALVSDADLAILGADPARYDEYTRQVRAEYATVPDDRFRNGRRAVLEQLLDLPALYATDEGRRRWSARAESNLRRELGVLGP